MNTLKAVGILRVTLTAALTLLLGAFHGFVGWHKALSSHEELVRHAAWTMHLPVWLGKVVGWTEMIVTTALLVALVRPKLARVGVGACVIFIVMELAAAVTHYVTRDGGSLAQNAVTISLTALLGWLYSLRGSSRAMTL